MSLLYYELSTDTQGVSSVCVALVFIVVEHPQEAYTHSESFNHLAEKNLKSR